jgi:hypothetical protein
MKTNKKQFFWISLCVILVVISVLVFTLNRDHTSQFEASDAEKDNTNTNKFSGNKSQNEVTSNLKIFEDSGKTFTVKIILDIKNDLSPLTYPVIENPPFELRGASGGRFAIRNKEGNIIRKGSEDDWVFSISASPSEKFIVVGAGDGNAYVIDSSGDKIIDLPQCPPGANMLGMGDWYWLSDEKLLGTSGLQRYDSDGKLISCCGGDNISESKMYAYDMNNNTMNELRLPESIAGKVLKVLQIKKSGVIQVAHEDDVPVWIAIDYD